MSIPDPETCAALFETAPDAILLTDAAGRIVAANAQAEKLFGRPRAQLVGAAVDTLVPERLRPAHAAHRERYARAAAIRHMGSGPELLALRADGVEIPVEIALGPVESAAGRLVAATIRDVSDLSRTRQAAVRGRYNLYVAQFGLRALQQPELAGLVDAAAPLAAEAMRADAAAVFLLSADRRELRAAASHGTAAEGLARIRVPNDPASPHGDVAGLREPVAVADAEAGMRAGLLEPIRALGFRALACVPLFGGQAVIGALVAASRAPRSWDEDDVHFMQSVANTLSAARERAAAEERLLHAQRLEALGQLTGGVAHDFNNLLMVVSGNLQMLEDALADRPGALVLSRQAVGAVERGSVLTRKLLAFARKQPLNLAPVDLNGLVTEFRELVQRTLGERVTVRLNLEPGLPVLLADAAQVETALLNLALNARDAMPQGGVLTIETARERLEGSRDPAVPELAAGDYARLAVTDTGVGMSAEVLARAIEPFFTTKDAGKGSGLGLSMVYGFARQSEGTVTLRSEPGMGTRAALYLPLPPDAQNVRPGPRDTALPSGSETVLAVEDDAPVLAVAVAHLRHLGYRVLTAPEGQEALRLLGEHPEIELLFTDLALPGMDGVALAEAARARRPGLPVIYTSGDLSSGSVERLPREERIAILAKPYRREELAYRIRSVLAQRGGRA